ncbi:MAG: hypothetical protein ABW072_03030 [Sedimenticola sp.]
MPSKWLQIKGDPSVREFLFQQSRKQSLFDEHIDKVHRVIYALLTNKGAFQVKAHYSSSQLTCWFYDDPYNYRVYVKEEICDSGFLDSFPSLSYEGRQPSVEQHQIGLILDEFRRLRLSDAQVYLRSASINRLNGMIGMNFSCDGTHYIQHDEFFQRLCEFGAVDPTEGQECTAEIATANS